MKAQTPSYLNFKPADYAWKPGLNYREDPELYRVGRGEQGVLICEPYKSEIGQYWRFKTEQVAEESSGKIYSLFLNYLNKGDFVGADMARKYLQMGYTRARRYANYKGGKKYDAAHDYALLESGTGEEEKAKAAQVFYVKWKMAEAEPDYQKRKAVWKKSHG